MNILVVDDEKEIAELVEIYLKNENYNVDVCYTGTQALHNIRTHSYDLAILDAVSYTHLDVYKRQAPVILFVRYQGSYSALCDPHSFLYYA